MEGKKIILVTGGAGFIGSHLCERLAQDKNNRVVSLDNYFTGSKDNHVDGVEYIEGHTKDIEKLITFCPDMIYHLGEYARVAASLKEPNVVWDLNTTGSFAVFEFWRKHKCKLLYAGSSTKSVGPRKDGVSGRDLSPYTWSKAVNTELVVNYGRWENLPYVVVYFYNVYGERERPIEKYGTLVETFRQKYLNGESFEVRAPGTQTRCFTYVGDTVSGIILAGDKGEGDEYGISSECEYSLLDVANMFGGEIKMLPQTKSTREKSVANSSKIKALGWSPKKTLKEYIEESKKSKKI